MGTLIFLGIVLAVFALILAVLQKKAGEKLGHAAYVARSGFMSPSEKALFHSLKLAFPSHHIFAQVRLADLVDVHPKLKGKAWSKYFNPIARKSVDFVLCGSDLGILMAIELDDPTHRHASRQKADSQKNDALQAAGIKLRRISGKIPQPKELQALLNVS